MRSRTKQKRFLQVGDGRDGDVDAEVAVVREELRDAGVEDETVRVVDGRGHAFVDRPRRRLVS